MKVEAEKCGDELKEWKKRIIGLQEREAELREKIKVQCELNRKVEEYSLSV